MAETILCPLGENSCSCLCNCSAFTQNREITVNPLEIDENEYTFSYTITNSDPAISFVIFCVECPKSIIEITTDNTSIDVIGHTDTSLVTFTECFTPGCESSAVNRFYVEFNDTSCCRYQGFKVDVNPNDDINEITFEITFTLPEDLIFGFNSGSLKIKSGQITEIINDICMPGCAEKCDFQYNVCNTWQKERNILESNKDIFIHFAQLLLPPDLDLSTITIQELENKIRSIAKLENCTANLICNIAKILEKLNLLKTNICI